MMLRITLGVFATIVSLQLFRQVKKSDLFGGGFIKLIDDELLFLFLGGLPFALIIFGIYALLTKFFHLEIKNVKVSVWIMRIATVIQLIGWFKIYELISATKVRLTRTKSYEQGKFNSEYFR